MPVNLLRDLLKIPSSSGNEKELGIYLVKILRKNFQVKIQKVKNNFNILAFVGKPDLILTTHLDTVPEQLEIKEDNNFFYGRGACDAKGAMSSMIIAAEKAKEKGLTNFGLLFDVQEESDFSGIKKAINLVNPKYVIVGEPTNFKIIKGQKGLLGIKVICKGKSAHGSTPEKGISAISNLINILSEINKLSFPESSLGKTTINIGKINGGTASNVVPDYAEATIELRTTITNKKILKIIYAKISKSNINLLYSFEPVINKSDFIKDYEKITVPYFTEMYFWNKKSKTVVFGPGNPDYAHSNNEKIKKSELIKASKEYYNIISTLSLNTKKYSKGVENGNSKRL